MADSSSADTTKLLRAWASGDSKALDELTPRVYRELRRMAARLLRNERPGYSLQSADLVHEVYLRLVNARELNWQDRAHFFAVSATLMRRILLDRARRRVAAKRGGKVQPLDLNKTLDIVQIKARELVALDDALNALAEVDPRKSRIVELRFFGRPKRKRDCRSGEGASRYRAGGLEVRQGLAVDRVELSGVIRWFRIPV